MELFCGSSTGFFSGGDITYNHQVGSEASRLNILQYITTSFLKLQSVLSRNNINKCYLLNTEDQVRNSHAANVYPIGIHPSFVMLQRREPNDGCSIFFEVDMQCVVTGDFEYLNLNGTFECCASQFVIASETYLLICIYRPKILPLSNIDIFSKSFR